MTFDEWNKKHGAFDYLDTSDEVRAAEAGWNAALKHSENAAAQVPETVRTGETDLGLSTPAAAALLEEAYALLRAAAVGTNIVGDAGEWCLRAAAHSAGGRYAVQIVGPAGRVTWLDAEGEETDDQDKAFIFPSKELAELAEVGYIRIGWGNFICQAVDLDAEPRE